MIVEERVSLKPFNTFGIESIADKFIQFHTNDEIINYFRKEVPENEKLLILGGGSNILFTSDFRGTVVKNTSANCTVIKEDSEFTWIKGDAGIIWNDFVKNSLNMGLQGIENLTLIPGTLGAAPIQNIGAYGVELESLVDSVQIIEIASGSLKSLNKTECKFGYRDSIFKNELKGKSIILSVILRLNKVSRMKLTYKDLQKKIQEKNISDPSPEVISSLITEIRNSKLPDPALIGNAGSVFKNPVVPILHYQQIKSRYHDLPSYPFQDELIKIPAAWLIEKCGWKGYKKGNVGVYEQQPLVLVNLGLATGQEILNLAKEIISSVYNQFRIQLELEINVI